MSGSERQKKTKKANKHSQGSTHIPIGCWPRGKARTQNEGKKTGVRRDKIPNHGTKAQLEEG